jgi:hypothetical protein
MLLLGVKAEVEAHFSLFGDNANLTQERCTVCTEITIGLKIVLDAPDGTAKLRGSCGISFGPFGNGVSVGVR